MSDADPAIAAELVRLLTDAGWTVRKLREAGFGGASAERLLAKAPGLPSLDSAERALALLGRQLWHRKRPS